MNTFGVAYSAGVTSEKRVPLYDPRKIRESRSRFRRDQIPELAYANSIYIPSGRWPTRGWILLARQDYDNLAAGKGLYGTVFQLQIDECVPSGNSLTFKNLVVVQAQCVTTGIASDSNAVYLVEITDARGLVWNRWFQKPVVAGYNVRSPAYPDQYYSLTINGGIPWTWNQLCQNLWPSELGVYPGLPIVPASTPENWNLFGMSVFQSLCDVLDHLGCTIAVDLTKDSPFTIVSQGASDSVFDALTAQWNGRKEDDQEWIDTGSGRVSGTVTVLFHIRYQYYGTEESIRNDSLQWQTKSVYQVSQAAPAFFTGAVGTHYLCDDFQVRVDIDGNPFVADITTANAIATERIAQYFDRIYSGTQGFLRRVYGGIVPFATGSLVDGVCFRQDFREPFKRQGWLTEAVRGLDPPWPQVKQ
jgi:hypothetical protein